MIPKMLAVLLGLVAVGGFPAQARQTATSQALEQTGGRASAEFP